MVQLRDRIRKVLNGSNGWTEIRYHKKASNVLGILKGEVSEMSSKKYEGAAVRSLVEGVWGFASTSDLSEAGLQKAVKQAQDMAKELAVVKKQKIKIASTDRLARGDYIVDGFDELENRTWDEKFELVRNSEEKLRHASKLLESAAATYAEVFEEKIILTSDGADAHMKLVRPEFRLVAVAADGSKRTRGYESIGVTGGWNCLFRNRKLDELLASTSQQAVDLLKAPPSHGGRAKVILSPAMVGLLCHEAIGHTVEADFVLSGSVAADHLGKTVASSLVTLCDSGASEYVDGAGGTILVDDEGILTQRTEIIKDGKLVSFLHNRESAAHFGVAPTGNARAWEFSDEPLIRMRNTYIKPGNDKLEDMIAGIEDGYFVDGPEGGQADATGEFMFGASRVRRIKNGKLGEFVQNVTVSGQAFEVLKTVDAVSRDFKWDLGAGHCGKGQPAKVDAGGPYIRCELLLGGRQ